MYLLSQNINLMPRFTLIYLGIIEFHFEEEKILNRKFELQNQKHSAFIHSLKFTNKFSF